VRLSKGEVTDATVSYNPTVLLYGSTTAGPAHNYVDGYVPVLGDQVLVIVDGSTRFLIGVMQ
jgi:hypothetical protein